MRQIAARFAAVLLLLACYVAASVEVGRGNMAGDIQPNANRNPPLWPAPAHYSQGSDELSIRNYLSLQTSCGGDMSCTSSVQSLLEKAVSRTVYKNMLSVHNLPSSSNNTGFFDTIAINVANPANVKPQVGMDESYTLSIISTNSTIGIECNDIFGCYHGLESLSQLIHFNFDYQSYFISNCDITVTDAPRFPHRGLLVDTSRHFIPLQALRQAIDSMTYAKLNVMHWHIVDAEAFPFDSPSHPKLGQMGAWSAAERYSVNDIEGIISYAAERGVRCMVEFDTPGHTASMCKGAPEVCPDPLCPSTNVNNWALDITKNISYTVAYDVLKDLSNLFFDDLMHLGGDEVIYYCWSIHPHIVDWLNYRNLTFTGGYEYWVKRMQNYTRTVLGRQPVGWEEIWNNFGPALHKDTIIQQWLPNSTSLPLNVTSHGYRLIWSDSSRWYLNLIDITWQQMYSAEPCNGLPDENCDLIIGGEGCMWGELMDESDIMQTVWPRQAAVAERLWSPRSYVLDNSTQAMVEERLMSFRCILNERGIEAAPVDRNTARRAPKVPGSCYKQ